MSKYLHSIAQATQYIRQQLGDIQPVTGMILGSGLGMMADEIPNPVKIPYDQIPGFPVSTVEGHAGQLVVGDLEGHTVMVMQGRFHFYEGYSMKEVTLPVRVMHQLGLQHLVVTNAAGGVNQSFQAGDLMLINGHINWSLSNPLIGPNLDDFGPRFLDTSAIWDATFQKMAKAVAKEQSIPLQEGVYQFSTGPVYETPAEVRAIRILGADAVGMSTVPEAMVAKHCSMRVLGISCISNLASGILDQPLSHDEVIETTERIKHQFIGLVRGIIQKMAHQSVGT